MATKTKVKATKGEREKYQPAPLPSRGEVGLTRADIAALLRITPRTLDNMVGAGQYPRCDFRMPDPEKGDPRWRLSTHDAWVRKRAGALEEPTPEG